MLWVCRAGINAIYLEFFLEEERIFLPWEGFKVDLKDFKDREQLKELVKKEKGDVARTSISNWAGQLYSFCWEMKNGDLVLVPHIGSRFYTLVEIIGEYEFCADNKNNLWHSRKIAIKRTNITRDVFSQSMRYSLGAYRTVFKVKSEEECLASIAKIK